MTLKMKSMRSALLLAFMMFVGSICAQTVKVNVKDSQGEPVIGASVVEQDTKNGGITDFDGNFTIKLTANKPIVVSYIGMVTQTVDAKGKSSISIVLQEDATTLQDVVVVGYGTMKKSDLTGSISSVDTEKLNAKGATSVMGNLQGLSPGVNISQTSSRAGGGFNIEIRGKSSLGDNNAPLFVVDGVICDDIDWLNPQDVEKIDVLKDASSTAIYGSRATNGVVIVSTKSAKTQGGKATKPTISYDGYVGWTKIARKPDWMSGSDLLRYRFSRYQSKVAGNNTGQNLTQLTPSNYGVALLNYTDDAGATHSWIQDRIAAGDVDWTDLVTRKAIQTNHYLAVSGNSNNTNYHFGFGYQKEEGVYKNDDMYRYNLKGTVDTKINDYLSAGISFNGAYRKSTTVSDDAISTALETMNALVNPYDANGNLIKMPGASKANGGVIPTDGAQLNTKWNPLLNFDNSYYQQKNYQALANIYVEARPIEGLTLKTTFSPNYVANRAGEYDGSMTSTLQGADNRATAINTNKFSWTWDNQANYSIRIKDHSINAMYLFSSSQFRQEKYTQTVRGVVDQEMWYNLNQKTGDIEANLSDYTEWSMISHAFRLNYSWKDRYLFTGTVRWDGSSRFAEGKRWGSFPSLALAWRVTEEDFMKNISWLSNLKLRLSYGVTGNNYVAGKNYPTMVTVTSPTSYYGFADGSGINISYPSGIVNKDLTWEKTTEYNIGLDFGFLNNRITGSIDWYTKKSKDLLLQRQLIYELGGISLYDNVGTVKNTGVEISINSVNIKNKDWTWTTSLSFAHNKNKIVEVNGGTKDDVANGWFIGESINAIYNYNFTGIVSDQHMGLTDSQYALYQQKGGLLPRDQILSRDYYYQVYQWQEGMPIIEDLNEDGNIDADNDKKVLGHSDPTWTGSFTSTLTYKNFDFSFSIYTRQGSKMYSPFYSKYIYYKDRGNNHVNFDYYIPAGTLLSCDGVNADGSYINPVYQTTTHYGEYPFPTENGTNNYGVGNFYGQGEGYTGTESNPNTKGQPSQIVNGTYWKISNISLGYTFPKKLLQSWGCQHLRVYVNVTNPFVWSTDHYKGFDPEWADASLANGGFSTVTWQIGASIKF